MYIHLREFRDEARRPFLVRSLTGSRVIADSKSSGKDDQRTSIRETTGTTNGVETAMCLKAALLQAICM